MRLPLAPADPVLTSLYHKKETPMPNFAAYRQYPVRATCAAATFIWMSPARRQPACFGTMSETTLQTLVRYIRLRRPGQLCVSGRRTAACG